MSRHRSPVLAGLLAVGVVVVALAAPVLLAGTDGLAFTGRPGGDPPSAVLDDADRDALDAAPVRRGAPPPTRDPAVPLERPEVVVRAYLEAAHAVSAADQGATHLRAAPYAEPGTAPATVGVLALDPPAPGAQRTAAVVDLSEVAVSEDDRRRGYRAVVETRTGPPGGPAVVEYLTSDVVVARQDDGTWLVAAEQPENPDLLVDAH